MYMSDEGGALPKSWSTPLPKVPHFPSPCSGRPLSAVQLLGRRDRLSTCSLYHLWDQAVLRSPTSTHVHFSTMGPQKECGCL